MELLDEELQMSASMQKSWPSKRDCGALTWIPGGGSQKGERKRQGEDEKEPRPLNKRFKPSTLDDEEDPKPPGHLFDESHRRLPDFSFAGDA